MSLNREESIYMAKLCEQTERFEEMVTHMKQAISHSASLSIDERNLLSVAYKNTVGSRRTAWRTLSAIE
jgi:14-3-3 protein epsilon